MNKSLALIPSERIQKQIFLLRGQKVILGQHLAELYDVPAKALNQAVKRNRQRFPDDFMFQLDHLEFENLRSQTVTSSWGGARTLPYAFTEQDHLCQNEEPRPRGGFRRPKTCSNLRSP